MDGLPQAVTVSSSVARQCSLRASIGCRGIGLHSGKPARLTLRPAPVGTGIVLRRSDLGVDIPARPDNVIDTRLCTVVGLPDTPEVRIGTVEHVLAALAGAGVHNCLVEVDGPEAPILDGSAADFLFLIDCAGIAEQHEAVSVIEVLRPVRAQAGDAWAELRPGQGALDLSMSIAFDAPAIGAQAYTLRLTPAAFRAELARARTFTLASEVESLRAAGLARGGSLRNAIVVDGARVLNPGGLRMTDEFVRHKLLDAVGDLALSGAVIHGRFIGHRSGHMVNNRLLRTLFSDPANWRFAPEPVLPWSLAAAA